MTYEFIFSDNGLSEALFCKIGSLKSGEIQAILPPVNIDNLLKRKEYYSSISPIYLLKLINHLRTRLDGLIDKADEATIDRILSSGYFLVRYPKIVK